MSLKIASWRAPGSILEAPGLDFGRFWDAQVVPGWPQGLQTPCNMLSKIMVFGRSNLKAQKRMFLASRPRTYQKLAENLPRHMMPASTDNLRRPVDVGQELPRGGGAAVVPPGGFQLNNFS